jgi:hypothetical protein
VAAVFALIAIIIIIVVAVAASHSTLPGRGTETHPASADISISSCTVDPTSKVPTATGTIFNHSSGTSDYSFTISFLNTTGTAVSQAGGFKSNIAPHEATTFIVRGEAQVSGSVTCKVADITRLAAP